MPVTIRRPKAIVFDILGTASKSGFLERVLFPFLKKYMESFIASHWAKRDFIALYKRIQQQSEEFHQQENNTPIVLAHDLPQAQTSLINFINFVTENGIDAKSVTQLRFKVWFEGYAQSKIHTPIYSDVPHRMKQWFAEGVKFYVFSNTWIEAQRALLRNTNHGDLTNLISGNYDNDFGPINEPDTWRRLCSAIHEEPGDVLFLTKSSLEAKAAADVGVNVVLVLTHRHNVKAVSREDRQRFAYVRTLNDLSWQEQTMMPGSSAHVSEGIQGPIATAASVPGSSSAAISSNNTGVGSSSTNAMAQSSARHSSNTTGVGSSSTTAMAQSSARHSSNATSGVSSRASTSQSRPPSSNQ